MTRFHLSFCLVRVPVAGLLIAAAVLKAHQLAIQPLFGEGAFPSRSVSAAIACGEFMFGIWLMGGAYAATTRKIAIGVFVVFAVVSFFEALAGQESCGCFGKVSISPEIALAIDLAAVTGLLRSQTGASDSGTDWPRGLAFLSAGAGCAALGALAVSWSLQSSTGEEGKVYRSGTLVLQPERWVGKRFPLFAHLEVPVFQDAPLARDLETGKWIGVLYHHDCPLCREVIAKWGRHLESRSGQRNVVPRMVLIDCSYGDLEAPRDKLRAPSGALAARLRNNNSWIVQAPVVFELQDGEVTGLLDNDPSEEDLTDPVWGRQEGFFPAKERR